MAIHQAYQEIRYERPAIKVLHSDGVSAAQFTQVLLGIEEEAVPYAIDTKDQQDGKKLAFEASQSSRLGIGIGVGVNGMFLHFEKLEEGKPLFELPLDASEESQRALGANAARLTKKLPFKSL